MPKRKPSFKDTPAKRQKTEIYHDSSFVLIGNALLARRYLTTNLNSKLRVRRNSGKEQKIDPEILSNVNQYIKVIQESDSIERRSFWDMLKEKLVSGSIFLNVDKIERENAWERCRQLLKFFHEEVLSGNNQRVAEKPFLDVFKYANKAEANEAFQHENVLLNLKDYQRKSSAFMIDRELNPTSIFCSEDPSISPMYKPLSTYTLEGKKITCYINVDTCEIRLQKPKMNAEPILGGILAEEMGLGKTIETLNLILERKNPKATLRFTKYEPPAMEEDEFFCMACGDREWPVRAGKSIQCLKCGKWSHKRCFNIKCESASNPFYCPGCFAKFDVTPTTPNTCTNNTTLIISPHAILHQWQSEIEKSCKPNSFKVMVYPGVKGEAPYVSLEKLSSCDIVLCSYKVLRGDLHHLQEFRNSRSRRLEQKYYSKSCPLTKMRFWRIVLDEAQMVEGGLSNTVRMALALKTVHRWCVTGTPIKHKISDLFGLLRFLRADPFDCLKYWNRVVEQPFNNGNPYVMKNILNSLMVRHLKSEVQNELDIPPQKSIMVRVPFHDVEKFLYKERFKEVKTTFENLLTRLEESYSEYQELPERESSALLNKLLTLRKTCCHPQLARALGRTLRSKAMTMTEMLKSMIKKTQQDCTDNLRVVFLNYNGLAGLAKCQGDVDEAIRLYRKVLKITEEYEAPRPKTEKKKKDKEDILLEKKFKVDDYQQLHVLHHLKSVLKKKVSTLKNEGAEAQSSSSMNLADIRRETGFGQAGTRREQIRALNAEILTHEARFEMIRNYLLKKAINRTMTTYTDLTKNFDGMEGLQYDVTKAKDQWYVDVLGVSDSGLKQATVMSLMDEVEQTFNKMVVDRFVDDRKDLPSIQSAAHLAFYMNQLREKLDEKRQVVLDDVDSIAQWIEDPLDTIIFSVKNCRKHIEREKHYITPTEQAQLDSLPGCEHCVFMEHHNVYSKCVLIEQREMSFAPKKKKAGKKSKRQILSEVSKKKKNKDVMVLKQPSIFESLCKVVSKWVAKCRVEVDKLLDTNLMFVKSHAHLKWFGHARKEVDFIREYLLNVHDNLGMRSELKDVLVSLEIVHKFHKEIHNVNVHIPKHEIGLKNLKFQHDLVLANDDFQNSCSQLSYLLRLASAGTENVTCPICQEAIDKTENHTLVCAHSFCKTCWEQFKRVSGSNLRCPVCRGDPKQFKMDEQMKRAVSEREDSLDQERLKQLQGRYGSKVQAVVNTLRKLDLKSEKSIVFCIWDDILSLVEKACKSLNIRVVNAAKSDVEKAIRKFKTDKQITVLLLPTRKCGKGLTLNVAQNVLCIEAVLNPSLYLQSIGRIHRIGQTKKTTVFRYAMENSIEVNIWKHIDSISGKIDINKSVKAEKQGLTINDFKKIIRDVKEDAPEDIDEEKEDEISEIAETSIEEQEMSDSDAELEDKTIPSDFEELPELEELDLEE